MNYKKLDSNEINIGDNAIVTVKEMGKVTEITYNQKINTKPHTIKLDKEHYFKIKTGEVLEYEDKAKNRSQSISSLNKTFQKIGELIQTNVIDNSNVRWVTLTYKENMTDTKKLYNDFRKFVLRFRTYCKKIGYKDIEYIAVAEPQERGAWHMHIIFIFNRKAPFIANDDLARIWKYGFTKITKLDDTANVIAYLKAYLCDVQINEVKKDYFDSSVIKEKEIDRTKKYFIKNARLGMYPSNFNILRHSRGIKHPIKKRMSMQDAMTLISNKQLVYRSTYELSNEDGYSTVIDKREYK